MFLFFANMSKNLSRKSSGVNARGMAWRMFFLIVAFTLVSALFVGSGYYNKGVDKLAEKTGNKVRLWHVKELPFRLGLDLVGGSRLVYTADMSAVADKDKAGALEGVRDVIERRVNAFGVGEPNVQTNRSGSEYQIIVELAGISDINEAIKMIGETPLLQFKEESDVLSEENKKQLEEVKKQAETRAEDVLGKLLSGGNFGELAKSFSDDENTKESNGDLGWITEKDNPEVVNIAKKLKKGEFTRDLEETQSGFELVKLNDRRNKTNPFDEKEVMKEYKASVLTICFEGNEGCESKIKREEAMQKINEIKKNINPKNFAAVAKENSTDKNASVTGGSLGWVAQDATDEPFMVEPFFAALAGQKSGTISFVVETKAGLHLIYKEDERNIEEFNISHILVRSYSAQDIASAQGNWKNTELTGKNLSRAVVAYDPNTGMPQVSLEFDEEGAKMFADITGRNVQKQVAIFLDGYVISAPNVNEKISGGKAVISGSFNIQEAKLLAQRLNAGALPVPIDLVNQQNIGASLGQESLVASLDAGLYAFALVAVFMILFYRFPGFLSVISLLIYGLANLFIFKLSTIAPFAITLTLSGIAGFIMSIGVAVDANILIFARLREELKSGKPLALAMEDAFQRAWPSIRDSNLMTAITCFILIMTTSSMVKGFAVNLLVGVAVSMFTAIFVTRNFLRLIPASWLESKPWLIGRK